MSATSLIDAFSEQVTVTRDDASGTWSNGVFVPNGTTQFTVKMSVQPMNGKELLNVPEAQRTRRLVKGYCATELKTGDQESVQQADIVTYNGSDFEVQTVEYWRSSGNTIAPYYRVVMAEVNP